MRHLLNTLFITSEEAYATLDGENIVIKKGESIAARYPLHTLQGVISFSYAGASPALMGACAKRGIDFVFCTPRGKFLARCSGESRGNVLLRRSQYRAADDFAESNRLARSFIFGKLHNARGNLERMRRDHPLRIDTERFAAASESLKALLPQVLQVQSAESLLGMEGAGASVYFGCFDDMILREKDTFFFHGRNRRPPLDRVNALLSFAYTLLGNDCASALEAVGLDAYVGFLHRDRPGRTSLAQDILEELRPCFAERFVLTLINDRVLSASDFEVQENGAVLLTDEGRRSFLRQWQTRKNVQIMHPFLKEKLPWGLVPYVQALLLARYLRGDLDAYPPFLWK